MHPASGLLIAAVLATPALAGAARIVVAPFTGPSASASQKQIAQTLCEAADCVAPSKVARGTKPDWKKVKKAKVALVFTGKTSRVKKKMLLELTASKASGAAKFKKVFVLDKKGRLSDRNLETLLDLLPETNAPPVPEESVAEPAPPPPPEPATTPVAEAMPTTKREAAEAVESSPETASPVRTEVSATEEQVVRRRVKNPVFSIEVGSDGFMRSLNYSNLQTPNLRTFQAFCVGPRVKVELYPLAKLMSGVPSGIGLEGGYATTLGLSLGRSDGPSHPATISRLDVGAKLRLQPSASFWFAPAVGYRSAKASAAPASDGAVLDGLPGISYSAVSVGASLGVSFGDGAASLFAQGAYLPVLSSGEIVSDSYFKSGSAAGLEATAGFGVRLVSNLEARLSGQWTRYGLTFRTEDTDAYIASGAIDQSVGGNLSLRFAY